jgi:hypothetical protein
MNWQMDKDSMRLERRACQEVCCQRPGVEPGTGSDPMGAAHIALGFQGPAPKVGWFLRVVVPARAGLLRIRRPLAGCQEV